MRHTRSVWMIGKIISALFMLQLLATQIVSAEELIGEYLFFENLPPDPDGVCVQNRYPASLWIDKETGVYTLQLNISDTETERCPISPISHGRFIFFREEEIYTFEGFLDCDSPIIASGNTIAEPWGLWQLWRKKID